MVKKLLQHLRDFRTAYQYKDVTIKYHQLATVATVGRWAYNVRAGSMLKRGVGVHRDLPTQRYGGVRLLGWEVSWTVTEGAMRASGGGRWHR